MTNCSESGENNNQVNIDTVILEVSETKDATPETGEEDSAETGIRTKNGLSEEELQEIRKQMGNLLDDEPLDFVSKKH